MKIDVQLINLEKSDREKIISAQKVRDPVSKHSFQNLFIQNWCVHSNQANCTFLLKCCFAIIASRNSLTLHFQ